MKLSSCLTCKKPINGHFNRKRCKRCAAALKSRPLGHLTAAQEKTVRRLAGKMFYEKLAIKIGSSRSNLMRWARDRNDISLNAHSYKPEVVRAVCGFYELHGRVATQKAFPKVNVRSIVERYKLFSPRQTRWTDDQIIEATRMAGLISPSAQAKYFNRPGAHVGAIRSLWMKRFGFGQCGVNGMAHDSAKHLVTNKARYLQPVGEAKDGTRVQYRRLILWVDMEKCLKSEVPDFMCEAIYTLARFQRWLWQDDNPRSKILRMIREREATP